MNFTLILNENSLTCCSWNISKRKRYMCV